MKIRPVGAELFHSNGRIDRHNEANNRLANAPKNSCMSIHGFAVIQPVKAFPTSVEPIFPLPCSHTFVFDR